MRHDYIKTTTYKTREYKGKFQIGDKVELLRDELLDDAYLDKDRTKIAKGTIMVVVHVTPKVCMVKGESCDANPYFLNLELPDSDNHNRVRTDFCNVKKVK